MNELGVDNLRKEKYNNSMDKWIKDALADSVRGFRLPRYSEIPDVGLYLEQATKYINQCIRPLGFPEITSAMIRNYVKQGLIVNPVKKQYSANQIAHLITIAVLKHATPLEYINMLFERKEMVYTDQVAYDYFCTEMENVLYLRFGLKDSFDDVGVTSTVEKEMLRSAIVAVSHISYLNTCFRILSEKE